MLLTRICFPKGLKTCARLCDHSPFFLTVGHTDPSGTGQDIWGRPALEEECRGVVWDTHGQWAEVSHGGYVIRWNRGKWKSSSHQELNLRPLLVLWQPLASQFSVGILWLLLKHCIYCAATPSLHRESTNSLYWYYMYLLRIVRGKYCEGWWS